MTDDLVKALRDAVNGEHDMTPHGADCLQAADRIEALEAKLAKAVEAISAEAGEICILAAGLEPRRQQEIENGSAPRTTLAEIEGEKG